MFQLVRNRQIFYWKLRFSKIKNTNHFSLNFGIESQKIVLLPVKCRDANFYRLPVVTTENCKNFQFSTDYGKLEFFKKGVISNAAKKALNKRI